MTTYIWDVTSGNFGAASSWSPKGTPTDDDATSIGESTSLFGSGSAYSLTVFNNITVTISAALTTDIADYVDVGATSALTTVDVDAAWTNTSEISVGAYPAGNGAIDVNAGGSLTTAYLWIGQGGTGVGAVTVQNGGVVRTDGASGYYDEVGSESTGTLTVTGKGSSWTSDTGLNVGDIGTGTLYVEDSATLNTAYLDVGDNYDEPNVASGSGTIYVESGGVMTTTGAYQEIGNGAQGGPAQSVTGSVTVTGAGSKWNADNGAIEIGGADSKSGSLTISDDGNVTASYEFDVGTQGGGTANDGSYGTLLIESGGTAVTGGGSFDSYYDESYDAVGWIFSNAPKSTATVTGAGSSWKMSAVLNIESSGEVFATGGGTIDTDEINLYDGALLKVDTSSTVEAGQTGGAALGFLTVDPNGSNGDAKLFGDGMVDADVIDNGDIFASDDGTLTIQGPTGAAGTGTIAGTGVLLIGAQGALSLSVASVASTLSVRFLGWDGTLGIESTGFHAPIYNFNAGDTIDIEGLSYDGGASSYTFTPSGANGGGTLVVTEGSSKVTLDVASSPRSISGDLTLAASANGTDVTFTNGAAQSSFTLWSSVGSFFNTASGTVNGEDYALSNASDGGAPVWVETEAPASGYVSGAADTYTIVLATQDWIGDVQPEMTIATDSNLVDPFADTVDSVGNLATPIVLSHNATQGSGAVLYWTASSTTGDYAVAFQPFTASYPTSAATSNFVTTTGSPVTMIPAIADPLNWTVSVEIPSTFVFAYAAAAANSTENVYFEAFNASGQATNSGPVLIANLPEGTPYYIGGSSTDYDYRYFELDGPEGAGIYGGSFSTTADDAVGSPSLLLSLPQFTAVDGIGAYTLSSGVTVRIVEGVEDGDDVIETFPVNDSDASGAQATFKLSAANDYFQTTSVFDPNDGQMDYIALAYTDAGKVHLELLNENGAQVGGDYVVPGISSFLRLHTLTGTNNDSSTRVELDYEVADPGGGQKIEGFIYDTDAEPYQVTLSGGGLYDGSPFDDTFTWGAGVYTIDGGGGNDTLSATSLSASQVTLKIDAAGETLMSDGAGDIDTLRRFKTLELSNATVTISGNTLTETTATGAKVVSTYNIAGQSYTTKVVSYSATGELLSTKEYNAGGALVGLFYTSQIPNDFTGDGRSDILFQSAAAPSALATWQVDDTTLAGGGALANPGPAWTYEGDGDFYGNGHSDVLWRNQSGQLAIWEMNGTAVAGSAALGNPGGTWSVVGEGDFYGNGYSDILFQDASGDLAVWEMENGSVVGGGTVGNPGANYRLVGTGDFNGDGKSDLLFESLSGQYAIWNLNGAAVSGGATLGSPGAGWVYEGIGDFDGLGDSDILFENANTGEYASWDVSDDKLSGGGDIGNPGPAWTLKAIGDYSTTGRSSLLFENTFTGQLASWDINDTSLVGGGNIGNPGAAYAVVDAPPALKQQPAPTLTFINATSGQLVEWDVNNTTITGAGGLGAASGYAALAVADFNGDGQSDVLFSKAGSYAIWDTNGQALTGGGTVGSPGSAYAYKGVGDFNGDGKSDILFEEANGTYAAWDLNGTQIVGGGAMGNPGAGLTYVGAGDFIGDGTSDLLLKDASGNYWISFVSDGEVIGTSKIGDPGAGYTLAAIGDLNGDGKADLLFSKNGVLASWDLDGASIVGGGTIGSPGAAWTVAGIADLGADSHASIVFDNTSTGQVATWLMNDTSIIGGGTIGAASGYSLLGVR